MLFAIGDQVRVKSGVVAIGGGWMPAGTACAIFNVLRTTRRKWFVVKTGTATAVVLASNLEFDPAACAVKLLVA